MGARRQAFATAIVRPILDLDDERLGADYTYSHANIPQLVGYSDGQTSVPFVLLANSKRSKLHMSYIPHPTALACRCHERCRTIYAEPTEGRDPSKMRHLIS